MTAAALGTVFDRIRAVGTGPGRAALDIFAIRIAAAGFAYGAQVLTARLMGWEEYGIFATTWVWTAMAGHSITLGLSQSACRFLPVDQARGDLDHARGYLAAGALVTGGAALAVALLGALLLALRPDWVSGPYRAPLLVAACVLPLFSLQDFLEGVARSQNWGVLAIAPPYLLRQTVMMAAMLAAILLGAPAEAWVAMACMLIAAGLAVTIQAGLVLGRMARTIPKGPRRYRWRHWLGASLPIALIDLANAGFTFVDVVVLGFLMPPSAVGLYFAATRIQQFVAFVHFAATAATAQRFSAAHAVGDRTALAALVRLQGRATLAATALVALCVVAASPLLLAMFGPQFPDSVPLLAILAAGSVAASLFGPGEDLLTMLGGERLCAGITLAMLALAVGGCLALVPSLGVTGAALAMAFVTVLRAGILALAAGAVHGLSTPVWSGTSPMSAR
ncbi:lipopolysaccharide biosynthesis protein [uncultured Methylobacterium sp.]|uniref:lipopolysaccharide biosynthesis protein n=1 Tax=uncultured Methylobacterium sp. TaxID=157278 RepID=UPI0035CC0045